MPAIDTAIEAAIAAVDIADTAITEAVREQPKPRRGTPGGPCYNCGEPDSWFKVVTKYFCCRSCAEAYCL